MGKQKSDDKKKKKKSSQLVIRIEAGERDAFVKLCDTLDTSAAREIRRFMRDRVAAHAEKPDYSKQSDPASEPAAPETSVSQADVSVEEKPTVKGKRKRPADTGA